MAENHEADHTEACGGKAGVTTARATRSGQTVKAHALELTDALRRSDQVAAENAYRAGLAKAPNAFVQLLRKEGTLRFSRYDFASDILIGLLRATSSESSTELSAESRRYLRSMEALGAIAPAVQKRFLRIRKTINARSFKSYLVTVDCLFREKHEQIDPNVRETWQNFSKEELCDAFSYYCSLLGHDRLPDLADLNLLIESKVGGQLLSATTGRAGPNYPLP